MPDTRHGVDSAPEIEIPARVCGRCRASFPADATLPTVPLREWWACEPCREVLFGHRATRA